MRKVGFLFMRARLHVLLWVVSLLVAVWAQSSDVQQCIPAYHWSLNSRSQTPCLVAAYLESACGKPTSVDAVPVGFHYLGPTVAEANECRCSSVTYSLISACGGCQGRNFVNWTTWSTSCSQTYDTTFPRPIPYATTVPSWAFLDLSETDNNFSPVRAAQVAGSVLPSSILSYWPSSASTTVTPSQSMTGYAASFTSAGGGSTDSQSTKSQPNAAAIAGGVVGGLVGLALILLILLKCHMKKRSSEIHKDLVFDSRALVSGNLATTNSASNLNVPPHSYGLSNFDQFAQPMSVKAPQVLGSPYSSNRRSLESVSPSMMQFGGALQPHRHGDFGLGSEEGHAQMPA